MTTATKERMEAERAEFARQGIDRTQDARRAALQEVDALAAVAIETGELPDMEAAALAWARAETLARIMKVAEPRAARLERFAASTSEREEKKRQERERQRREEQAESLRAKAVLLLDRLSAEHGRNIPVEAVRKAAASEDVPDHALSEVARSRGMRELRFMEGVQAVGRVKFFL